MSEQLYRWVKASERMPPVNILVFLRDLEGSVYTDKASAWDKNITDYEWLEPLPLNADVEQDFKELNIYLNDIYEQAVRQDKDAGNLWIQFTDKFNAFREKIIAGAASSRPSIDIVDELRKENPFNNPAYNDMYKQGYLNACKKLEELLNQSK